MDIWLSLLLAGIFAIALNAKRRTVPAVLVLQIGMLIATWAVSSGLTWMDPQISARGALAVTQADMTFLSNNVSVFDVPRGIHYGLNFYLRREIPQWTNGARGLVFSSWKGTSEMKAQGYACQEGYVVFPAVILCKWSGDLPRHAPGSGKPQ